MRSAGAVAAVAASAGPAPPYAARPTPPALRRPTHLPAPPAMRAACLLPALLLLVYSHVGESRGAAAVAPAPLTAASSPPAASHDDDDDDEDDGPAGTAGGTGDTKVYKNPRNSPSAQCPRDEEQATLLGQRCLRKCSSDEDCKSKKKKCLCDGACGMSCIKPDRECPELAQPELGAVMLTGRLFGDKATYSCPHGYHVVGLGARACQADGQWAGAAPACKENIYCLQPPTIEHARHSALPDQATFDLDATVQYHCHAGYVTNGFPRAKCLAIDGRASWYGPDISCEPRSCGSAGEVAHGWVSAECVTFGCRASVQCGAGFELVGAPHRHCTADGLWLPPDLPVCVLVTSVVCEVPEAPRHGKAVYTSCAYNSVVSYECKYGYRLVGDATRRCGADRKWSGAQPVCKEINCGHPGPLWHGWLENVSAGTGLGASIIFRCHDGMKMEGNSSAICQADGTWTNPLPKCLAPCVVPHVTQGRVSVVERNESGALVPVEGAGGGAAGDGDGAMVGHGALIVVACAAQYEWAGVSGVPGSEPIACSNGTWTAMPRCTPARCRRPPPPPRNGMVLAPSTAHGMRARFRCKDGYQLVGPPLLTCSYGQWTGETPHCEEVFCPYPGHVEHGKVLLVGNMGLYDYRPYVKKVVNNKQIMYECDKGYFLAEGPPGATCIAGHWRPSTLPRCALGQHPRIRWSRRRRRAAAPTLRHAAYRILSRLEGRSTSGGSARPYVSYQPVYGARSGWWGGADASTPPLRRPQDPESPTTRFSFMLAASLFVGRGRESKARLKLGHEGGPHPTAEEGDTSTEGAVASTASPTPAAGEQVQVRVRGRPKSPCPPLPTEPYLVMEVLKTGRDPNNSFSSGSVVRVSCGGGWVAGGDGGTAKCVRGRWKPSAPLCHPLPCTLPTLAHGNVTLVSTNTPQDTTTMRPEPASVQPGGTADLLRSSANRSSESQDDGVPTGTLVRVTCEAGWEVDEGRGGSRCWLGEWTPTPSCRPAGCTTPDGNVVKHGETVRVQCGAEQGDDGEGGGEAQCRHGALEPDPGVLCPPSTRAPPAQYRAGADVVQLAPPPSCPPPRRVQGALVYGAEGDVQGAGGGAGAAQQGESEVDGDAGALYAHGTELVFRCIRSLVGESASWRVVCERGQWRGAAHLPSLCGAEAVTEGALGNNTAAGEEEGCVFEAPAGGAGELLTFYEGLELSTRVTLPEGAELLARCSDVGKWVLSGPARRVCRGAAWQPPAPPACLGLNQHHDYAMDKPPTILFRSEGGRMAQTDEGRLLVAPGTTLHMECLWMRRFGNPRWHPPPQAPRTHPQAWSTGEGRDSQLEYRLSIIEATPADSGIYRCETPARQSHQVDVLVADVECPPLELDGRLRVVVGESTRHVGAEVRLECEGGGALLGAAALVCRPSGRWSAPTPTCESVECGDVRWARAPPAGEAVHARVAVVSRGVGGRAVFSCAAGWALDGPRELSCGPGGEWGGEGAWCRRVSCPVLAPPAHGYAVGRAPHHPADLLQFHCLPGHALHGRPILVCQDSGLWSDVPPSCVGACAYPGSPIAGRMSSVKFYYGVGETVSFSCAPHHTLLGNQTLTCLKSRKWSSGIPVCAPAA